MRLRRLLLDRLPGIDRPFELPELGEGFHVIQGPNGIGKSSLCRAVEALLWAEAAGDAGPLRARALFELPPAASQLPGGAPEVHAAAPSAHASQAAWWVERDGPGLRWKREGREVSPPPLPPAHLRSCFFLHLRDLLELAPTAGQGVAQEIRRQMAGGFDLGEVERALTQGVGPRHGQAEGRKLEEAQRQVHQMERAQRELAAREARLGSLEQEAEAAARAQRRLAHVRSALELARVRQERVPLAAEHAALPEALARMRGDEVQELERAEEQLGARLQQHQAAERAGEEARARAEATGLVEALAPARLRELEERGQRLAELEREREAAREAQAEREAEHAEARRVLGDRAEPPGELTLADTQRLAELLRKAGAWSAAKRELDAKLALLAVPADEEAGPEARATREAPGPERLEPLEGAIGALRAWLREPKPEAIREALAHGRRTRAIVVALAAALALLGAALAWWVDPRWLALAGVGLGLAGGELTARLGSGGDAPVQRAQAAQDRAREALPAALAGPLAAVQSWSRPAATQRLQELEAERDRLRVAREEARQRAREREGLESRGARLAEERARLDAERRALAGELGLQDLPELEALDDAGLVDLLGKVDAVRRARAAARAAAARVAALVAQLEGERTALAEALVALGEPRPEDAAAARGAVASLRERNERLREAQAEHAQATKDQARLAHEIAAQREAIAAIYGRAGLEQGDRAGLAQRVQQWERLRELEDALRRLDARIEAQVQGLVAAGEAALAEREAAELEREHEELTHRAGQAEVLRQQIADIRSEVSQAREGHALETALAERDGARQALEERREEKLAAEAARFLLGAVGEEHEARQLPAVLERAAGLFAAFTHHRYELRVSREGAASFLAHETHSGRPLRPDQLSDGTRAQLVLAARLAFAEEVEREAKLPLFLDEALDHSDPERFAAIARSLARMAADGGRQIFYLTNDPNDVARLGAALEAEGAAPARVIDLAAVRGRAASVPGPEALRVAPLPTVPDPAGHTPESYGAALAVPPLEPARGAAAQHLFHLLWDDLPRLHHLLREGLSDVGGWQALVRHRERGRTASQGAEAQEGERRSAQLAARAALLEAFCQAWQVGRSASIDREELLRSGAVSETFLDRVLEVTRELDGDPARLLAALRERSDERLKGFRGRFTDQLEDFLTTEELLDPRAPLSWDALHARLLATPAAARLPHGEATACIHRWWQLAGGDASTPVRRSTDLVA